jgi:Spy/CpxP family protein refolding chaperone
LNLMTYLRLYTTALAIALALACTAPALAQHGGPGGPGGGPGGMPGGGGMPGPGGMPGGIGAPNGMNIPGSPPPRGNGNDGTNSTMHGGLQLAPPGRWWDDKGFAKSLGLRPEQKKKMDEIFNANKGSILERFQSLQREEDQLDAATSAPQLDEAKIFAAIDQVAQSRAALEKANAHMLLLIRAEMDQKQTQRLEDHR